MADEKDKAVDLFDKVKWVLIVIQRLWKQKFSGDLTLHFHEGNLSEKFDRKIIEYASKFGVERET